MDTVRNRIKAVLEAVEQMIYSDRQPVTSVKIAKADYHFEEEFHREGKDFRDFGRNETWGELDQHYFFLADVAVPEQMEGHTVRAVLNTGATDIWNTDNPQIMAYVNGRFAATLDMNHQFIILSEHAKAGETYELAFYAYSSAYAGTFTGTNFFRLELAVYREEAAGLYYDMQAVYEAADLLPEDNLSRIEGFKALERCVNLLDLRRPGSAECFESMKMAAQELEDTYYTDRRPNPVTVHSIGHTHIDVAWKWPLRQTRQKAVRSFETVLNLMDRYPEYRFMSSQSQLYEFVKEDAPGVFARIRERIKEGRWEAEGAMWLEPDCNISSGESLIRHIVYGRRFFEQELGAEKNEVLWLPDVFGYSAALPQILQKSGIPYFMTTKIGWNEFNRFPHDTFLWKGIDGTEVLTHLITTRNYQKPGDLKMVGNHSTTYNGLQNASQLMGTWQRYQDKDVSTEVLTCYGYGDGGGGPTEEMLEQSRRLEHSVVECPAARQTGVKEFFHILEEKMDKKRLAVWDGELYLEFHRGTYTSMAQNKKYNRKAEFKNGETELYAAMASLLDQKYLYPQEQLEHSWKLLLLNQFHDILPGSALGEVYEVSQQQYGEILASDARITDDALHTVAALVKTDRPGVVVFNQLGFARDTVVRVACGAAGITDGGHPLPCHAENGVLTFVAKDLPAKGWRFYPFADAEPETPCAEVTENDGGYIIDTPLYHIVFNGCGEITALLDKEAGRELIPAGHCANELQLFEDRPDEYDAWNLEKYYRRHRFALDGAARLTVAENSPVCCRLHLERAISRSQLVQDITLYPHSRRIDFATHVDWHEQHVLLKAAFPVDICADRAQYDIQFGSIARDTHTNTSWDEARFEVCAHKWADLSEPGYGAALLNDGRYGYDVHDGVLRLSLLRAATYPDPHADQGAHDFTYALLPHLGDWRQGGVIPAGYDLNAPALPLAVAAQPAGTLPAAYSQFRIDAPNVVLETVKKAEDGSGLILRLYESWGTRTRAALALPDDAAAVRCTPMEQPLPGEEAVQHSLPLTLHPFEICTIHVQFAQ